MKFDNILAYQKIDNELLKIESSLKNSKERKAYYGYKAKIEDATSMIKRLQAESNDIISQYERMEKHAQLLVGKIKEIQDCASEAADDKEIEHYSKLLKTLVSDLAGLEKEIKKDLSKVDHIATDYNKTWEEGQKASASFKKSKSALEKLKKDCMPKVTEIKDELAKIEGDIDPEILKIYKALRGKKKYPVFTKYDAEAKQCSRCFMEIPNDVQCKLKKVGDYAECPNCGRVIFVEN